MIAWLRALWCLWRHERHWLASIEGRRIQGGCSICCPERET
jgi:hypothetical protein